jgi:hypothetical protein
MDFFKIPPKGTRITINDTQKGVYVHKDKQGIRYRILPPYTTREHSCTFPHIPSHVIVPLSLYDENDGEWKTFLASASFIRRLRDLGVDIDDFGHHGSQPLYLKLRKHNERSS